MPPILSGVPIIVLAVGALFVFFITGKALFKFVTFGLISLAILYYAYITFFVGLN